MEKLYVLAGKARQGKDTVAGIMENLYKEKGKKVIRLSYGTWPKQYGKILSDWDGKDETKPRTLLQEIAVESRKVNPGYIIRRMEEDINILNDYFDIIIISDSRMPEELAMPKEKFKESVSIKVIRPNFITPLKSHEKTSITETSLDNYEDYDYIIENEGTLEDLKIKVEELIKGATLWKNYMF